MTSKRKFECSTENKKKDETLKTFKINSYYNLIQLSSPQPFNTDDLCLNGCPFLIYFSLFYFMSLLQTQTSCCYGCGGDQVTWRSANAAKNDTCLPCIDCPDGMEPSIRCGGVAKHGTDLHCVECKVGTCSDSYGKGQCRPCSLCSEGRSVEHNCSASQNRLSGSCNYGYYMNDVV